jgi:hypothetical protein
MVWTIAKEELAGLLPQTERILTKENEYVHLPVNRGVEARV